MSNKIFGSVFGVLLLTAAPVVHAAEYAVDPAASKIAFSGEQAGTKFDGVFKTWTAKIDFDPAALDKSAFDVTITTASAETGTKTYDATLPQKDWFNVEKFPTATFKTTKITAAADGTYKAEGDLTIRDVTKPVSFDFKIDDINAAKVHATGQLTVNRLDFGLGAESDAKAEWISKDIPIALDITAEKKAN